MVPRYANGTRVERVHDTDFPASYRHGPGRYGLEIGVPDAPDEEGFRSDWKYQVESEPIDDD